MNEFREDMPKSPSAMFDRLHQWFGIGESDETDTYRERMVEIAKLKGLMRSRRATLAQVWIAAQYARAHHKPVHATWQVFALIPEALRERFREASAARRDAAWDEMADAIREAIDTGEHAWADRLMRAQDQAAVLAEWRAR